MKVNTHSLKAIIKSNVLIKKFNSYNSLSMYVQMH